jgi:hypothetical protein
MRNIGNWRQWGSATRTGALLVALVSLALTFQGTSAAATPTGAVTSTSIRVGDPYVNLAPLRADGVNINQGSFPDAFNALIANLNAHGGINGRKIIPYVVGVNPISSTAAASACTQLSEDDNVFVALHPVYPLCYQQDGVPTINSTMGASLSPNAAPNFTETPPAAEFDPLEISVFKKQGVFKGKKIGVIASSTDQDEIPIVQAALKKQAVDVVETATDSAPSGDQVASDQQIQSISLRFKNAGVDEVVGLGFGAEAWLEGQEDNQSTYNPRIVATDYSTFYGTVNSKGRDLPAYLRGAITASAIPTQQVFWNDPAIKTCVRIIKKAYPKTVIGDPVGASPSTPTTWVAAENTCQDVALFSAIAKAAGKNLTTKTFEKAGYALRNVSIPGMGAPISFGPDRPYGLGPVYLVTYDSKSQELVVSNKSVNS